MFLKRQLLRITLKLMFVVGICFVTYIFFAALFVENSNHESSVIFDFSELQPGELRYYSIKNGKLLLLKRTDKMINDLANDMRDMYAFTAQQNLADDMDLIFRSKQKSLFVAYAVDPFYRCDITFTGAGFQSICIDVKYNLAGRAYKSHHAQGNLIVPDYRILPGDKLRLKSE